MEMNRKTGPGEGEEAREEAAGDLREPASAPAVVPRWPMTAGFPAVH
jgi:hypothetical protein